MKASNISRTVCFAVGGSAFRGRSLFLIRLPPTVILNRAGRFFLSLLPRRSNISTLPQGGRPAGVRTASRVFYAKDLSLVSRSSMKAAQ